MMPKRVAMSTRLERERREVVDLLCFPEGLRSPGMADLMRSLDAFARRRGERLLTGVLEAPGLRLSAPLRRDVEAHPAGRAVPATLLRRVEGEVADEVSRARSALATRLVELAPRLSRDELGAALAALWAADAASGSGARLAAWNDLTRSGAVLDARGEEAWPRGDAETRAHEPERLEAACARARSAATGATVDATLRREILEAVERAEAAPAPATEAWVAAIEALADESSLAALAAGPSSADEAEQRTRLERNARELAERLGEWAPRLPTVGVLELRRLIERARRLANEGSAEERDSLRRAIESATAAASGQVERLAQVERRQLAAERERLTRSARELEELAPRRAARALDRVRADLDGADASALPGVEARIERLRADTASAVRLDACRLLERAGSEPLEDDVELVEALHDALAGDDLHAVAEAADDLAERIGRGRRIGRAGLIAVAAVAGIVVLAAGVALGRRWLAERPRAVHVALDQAPEGARLALVREGRVYGAPRDWPGADGLDLTLPPGRYELYLDDRFTGEIVDVGGAAGTGR